MKIKHNEIIIPENEPFLNCKLNREKYAQILSEVVSHYADGFVFAINNEWGTGKTTFVKMWRQLLINKGFKSIYFNAWENDFDNNPLVALISEFQTLAGQGDDKSLKSVLEKGAILAKNVVPSLLKSLFKRYVDIEAVTDAVEGSAKGATEILEEEIQEFASKKKTISEFRDELAKYVQGIIDFKPIVFIIDELDRCRPSYSVEVLEQIKHFFSVPGIVFILSLDKKQLSYAINGYYGSEQFDSSEYLRRFIDLEYSIPNPSTKDFCKYLYHYYSFDDFFSDSERKQYPNLQSEAPNFSSMASYLLTKSGASLRQQERIFSHARLVLCSFSSNQYTFSHLLFFLIYLKTFHFDQFINIEKQEYSLQELSDLCNEILFDNSSNPEGINLLYIEALLLWFYNNDFEDYRRMDLIIINPDGKNVSAIKSKLESRVNRSTLLQCFQSIVSEFTMQRQSLKQLISKINLTLPIVINTAP